MTENSGATEDPRTPQPVISLANAGIAFGPRTLWHGLTMDIQPGEFVAVLGPNGAGKSTFLKVLLGLQKLSTGRVEIMRRAVTRGSAQVGYIPQQQTLPAETPMRARDLISMGIDGHRWGLPWPSRKNKALVNDLLQRVGATRYADQPVGVLSGGEQQRLRAAQALAGSPAVLLCDEPLHSLDLHHQRAIAELIKDQAATFNAAVIFVTHEINPVIEYVDKVLYFARGAHRLGPVDEVMRSDVLSELYQSPVDVIEHKGRLVIMADHVEGEHNHGLEVSS